MNKLKKLGKGLEDISYLFLSQDQEKDTDEKKSPAASEEATNKAASVEIATKSICLIGNSPDYRDAFLVINLSLALARLGMRIAVVDMDEELPCLNFFLGKEADDEPMPDSQPLVKEGPLGVKLVGLNRVGLRRFAHQQQKEKVLSQLKQLEESIDLILISVTQKNLSPLRSLLKDALKEYLILVPPDKYKMLTVYKIIKMVFSYNSLAKVGTIITDVDHMYEVDAVYRTMSDAVTKFLDKELYKYGFLFKLKKEVDAKTNIASFYDADLTACISNIAQIIVLRLNLGEAGSSPASLFSEIIEDFSSGR